MRKQAIGLAGLCVMTLALSGCFSGGHRSTAGKVMDLPKPPPAYPKSHPMAINPQWQAEARNVLDAATRSDQPFVRAHAIEAVADAKDQAQYGLVLAGLKDRAPAVQFAALMAAGDLQLAPAHEDAIELAGSANRHVRVAAIYALHRLGDTHLSHELEKLSGDYDPNIRADVAVVLGKIGNKTALRILRPMMMDAKPAVRLQVAEAMWRLGSDQGLKSLVGFSVSAFPDDRMVALLALAAPGDQRVREHVRGALVSEYPELNLVAARAMGMLQSDEGYGVAMAGVKSEDARQRQLAALAFGAIGRADAQPLLAPLLQDANADVRVAAAAALLEIGH
jgi:HEAT repeat protein